MNWKTWQGNIETLYKYFLGVSQPILLYGPMKRNEIIEYCVQSYSDLPKDINFGVDILTKYETTCNNTYIPAMFKLGMLKEDGNLIDFTPAAKQLINSEITPLEFFRRQIVEFQYKNPYQEDVPDCNLFTNWILLRFLGDLHTIEKEEALYVILKLNNYDEQIYQNALNDINELRRIKSTTPAANLDNALTTRFGQKNTRSKAWQYERNYLKWTGFCKDGSNSSVILLTDTLEELSNYLSEYPTYRSYISKQEYSAFVGRAFDKSTKIFLFNQDTSLDLNVNITDNKLVLETKRVNNIKKNDKLLFARAEDNFSLKEIWSVDSILSSQDKKAITCTKVKHFSRFIKKEEISSIIQ